MPGNRCFAHFVMTHIFLVLYEKWSTKWMMERRDSSEAKTTTQIITSSIGRFIFKMTVFFCITLNCSGIMLARSVIVPQVMVNSFQLLFMFSVGNRKQFFDGFMC